MVSEPCGLALGVLAGDDHRAGCGLGESDLSAQMGGEFRHAVGAHGWQGGVQVAGEQDAGFVQGAFGQHGGEAGGDGGAQGIPWRVQQDGA